MSDLSKELFAMMVDAHREGRKLESDFARHSQLVPLEGVVPKKNGKQADGSIWADGACIQPAPCSESEAELIRFYNRRGGYSGD